MIFAFPEQKELAASLGNAGTWEWRHFPDGESYVRVLSEVRNKNVTILCSLNRPDEKFLPLLFLARTLRELGAAKITLIAPYLGYMRQDTQFKDGEAVTADIFASLLSPHMDVLVTIDPHLHRHHRMSEIYHCESKIISASPLMAEWIKHNIESALLIGPDSESEQWVKEVAATVSAPYVILEKTRRGDCDVEITLPDISIYRDRTPVLVDDIISTAGTMIKTTALLRKQGFKDIVCMATHGIFASDAYAALQKAGAGRIITANTIPHTSNALDIAALLKECL